MINYSSYFDEYANNKQDPSKYMVNIWSIAILVIYLRIYADSFPLKLSWKFETL